MSGDIGEISEERENFHTYVRLAKVNCPYPRLDCTLVEPRFSDNGDGTILDECTRLVWLKNANCFGTKEWQNAQNIIDTLSDGSCGLTDGSFTGDWRLPTINELQGLINYSYYGPALSDDARVFDNVQFDNIQFDGYWSVSSSAGNRSSIREVEMMLGQSKLIPNF